MEILIYSFKISGKLLQRDHDRHERRQRQKQRHRQLFYTHIFVQPLRIGHIIIGLYRAARETGQFQAPVPKSQDNKPKKYRQQPLSVSLPPDVYLDENQA